MTGILIKRGKFGHRKTCTEGRQHEETQRKHHVKTDWSNESAPQGGPKLADKSLEARKRRGGFLSLQVSEGAQSWCPLDFRLPASRAKTE